MKPTRLIAIVAVVAAGALALSSCSGGAASTPSKDSGGVAAGATLAEYQAAFTDVDPIVLKFQTTGTKGSLPNQGPEAYAAAISKWSGGKITFEWGYSNAFVPAATEWSAGLADGRIDIGQFAPYYNPDVFPKLNALSDATFLDGNTPLSTLVSTGWVTQETFGDPAYTDEAAAGGVHLLTLAPTANIPGIFCSKKLDSLADFKGVPISASGTGRVAQLQALGFSTQSIAFTELYEALERHVVQCGSTVPSALDSIGAVPLVPYAVADPDASLTSFPIYLAIGEDKYQSLPLVAKQLLFDRLDAFLPAELKARSERNANWLDEIKKAGGGITDLAPDARKKLLAENKTLLAALGSKGVDTKSVEAAAATWKKLVNTTLYPNVTSDLEDYLTNRDYADIDFQPFLDEFTKNVLSKERPS